MDRLTANKDTSKMSMVELAHNCCYAKDGKARYRNFDKDIDARDFARRLMQKYGFWEGEDYRDLLSNNDTFDEAMIENLYYGEDSLEGLIALFYRNLWVMADLHNRLKAYEDTGLTPEKILELDKMYQELSKEVMQYRKAAEPYKKYDTDNDSKESTSDSQEKPDVTKIVIHYSDGIQKAVNKGCLCSMKLNEDETCIMDFTMANISGKELEYIVMGFVHLGDELGIF